MAFAEFAPCLRLSVVNYLWLSQSSPCLRVSVVY